MAVMVRYDTGATMSYHLTAYSPWEGYRVMFNGSLGRLELEVTERAFAQSGRGPGAAGGGCGAARRRAGRRECRRATAAPSAVGRAERDPAPRSGGRARRRRRPDAGGHLRRRPRPDPLGRRSSHRDGALSLLTGLAANESFVTGLPVDVADLVDVS